MEPRLRELYAQRGYPAMSHPVADPAQNVVAARLVGLAAPVPRTARVLEIGCASGHHLLPLAERWPSAQFTGIDFSEKHIALANQLAAEAGLSNVVFHECALEEFAPRDARYDFIIAHGFFSWVPDEVKANLLTFCRDHLSPSGIAVISFNVEAGWKARRPLIEKTRAIQQLSGLDVMTALDALKIVTADEADLAILDDMLAKGPDILPFDDFAPVNDAWPLDYLVASAARAGLRWLGESIAANNRPLCWTAEDEAESASLFRDRPLLELHQWMDERSERTFRCAMWCRADAPLEPRISTGVVMEYELQPVDHPPDPLAVRIHDVLKNRGHSSVPAREILNAFPEIDQREIAREILLGITQGWLDARCDAIHISPQVPHFPKLSDLRLACARKNLPVVDAMHKPCAFPEGDYAILSLMDGQMDLRELKNQASHLSPRLDFDRWIAHLNSRGMFRAGS